MCLQARSSTCLRRAVSRATKHARLTLRSSGPTRAGRATLFLHCPLRAASPCGPLSSNVRRANPRNPKPCSHVRRPNAQVPRCSAPSHTCLHPCPFGWPAQSGKEDQSSRLLDPPSSSEQENEHSSRSANRRRSLGRLENSIPAAVACVLLDRSAYSSHQLSGGSASSAKESGSKYASAQGFPLAFAAPRSVLQNARA